MFEEVQKIIGKAAAQKLVAHFAGSSIYVPVPPDTGLEKRNEAIRKARARGAAIGDLMRDHGLSRRSIWSILKGN